MTGIVYGIGVGPGDPELMTLKAVRRIRESDVIAVPGEDAEKSVAYRIARQAVPEIEKKPLLGIASPMVTDREELAEVYRKNAEKIIPFLRKGECVAFLTLGDPAVYSTFFYLAEAIRAAGYPYEVVSGVPSFCAAAAAAGVSLVLGEESLRVVPASRGEAAEQKEVTVLMKSGHRIGEVRQELIDSGKDVILVENCGMPDERIFRSAEEIPEDAGYFSLIITKDRR